MIRKPENDKAGSVLVLGAGIAGIQSSLDLANSGYKVFLVEDGAAIGGTMAQLDKTFPTNDCAMCVISPKLVECGRHLNIDLMTNSELKEVSGEAGNFKVKVYKRPRFVDLEKCTGCGECEKACPVDVPSIFDENLVDRKAIFKPYAQASPNAFVIDKKETAPCQIGCPSGIHVQGYIALAKEGRYKEAYDLIRMQNPFPSICGRVCHHPCETQCKRGDYDDPLAIASIKRYIADHIQSHMDAYDWEIPEKEKKEGKVAVVGAGPSGLTAAWFLAREGYEVTVFEKEEKAGGMMRRGIPGYRLSREALDWEIEQIVREGVELRTSAPIETKEDIDELREDGYGAVYLSVGFQKGRGLNIEGADLEGVTIGLDFLKDVNLGREREIGKRIVVIGGGNVAIDVAKCAVRRGSEVDLVCLECRIDMPAHEWEIEEAIEEGVKVHTSWGPSRIHGENGKVTALDFMACTSVFNEEGKFSPTFDDCRMEMFDCDEVIIAIGQGSDLGLIEGSDVKSFPFGTIKVDPVTFETDVEGIFAGGDIVSGPASVVDAVNHGHEAAVSISRYLRGMDLAEGRPSRGDELPAKETREFVETEHRVPMPVHAASERVKDFREFAKGFSEEEMKREAQRCLECGLCSQCLQCEAVCEADAVIHDMVGEDVELDIGAVIVATGAEKFDPTVMHEFGYGRYPNVLTSIQFERVLAASGPFEGHLQRPHDGKIPRKIAWIQCVGSRTEDAHMPYCSSVCCMYTMKEAIIAKEHEDIVEPTVFYMDIRAYGKDFERYYDRAKASGVRFVRGRVGNIDEIPESGNLIVNYVMDNGEIHAEEFDLVVLSVGLHPSESMTATADTLGVRLNKYGFIERTGVSQIETTRDGVFVCGPAVSPKDIPETVMQASGAVAAAAEILSDVRGTEITVKEYPEERDVAGQRPRIGVFVCHCGINIGSVVDVPGVVEYVKTLPDVVFAEDNLFTCSQDTQQNIKAMIDEHKLNRVVVSSCSPSTHEPLFQETLREMGLNPYLFDMANIRNHCSWVHRDDPEKATQKAKTLSRIAISKARLLEPLHTIALDVTQKGLVIGGGLAGMTAALSIAEQGFEVALVEREKELGGNLNRIRQTIRGEDVGEILADLTAKLEEHPLVKVFTSSNVKAIDGYIGNYVTSIHNKATGVTDDYEHGIIVITTGANEMKPVEYQYGTGDEIVTQLEMETALEDGSLNWRKIKNVAMIQCVGSRDEQHPYCSRVCCTQAVKNAIRIKEANPKTNVYVLYRDIRTYGFYEEYYQKARSLGVIFIRFEDDEKPVVEYIGEGEERKLSIRVKDHILGTEVEIRPDRVVLAPAIEPQEDSFELSQMLKIPLNAENFFMEAHVKLRPVDFSAEGIFLAGLAHSPKMIDETISQAKAAAERACSIISAPEYISVANIATLDEEICAGCGMCVSVCPFGAPELVWMNGRQVCHINSALCKGCGSCSTVCPSGAMQQFGFKEEQTLETINEALGML